MKKRNPPVQMDICRYYGRILREDRTKRQILKSHLYNVAEKALQLAKDSQPMGPKDSQDMKQWKEAFHNTAWLRGGAVAPRAGAWIETQCMQLRAVVEFC
jgi:hypothetical protein